MYLARYITKVLPYYRFLFNCTFLHKSEIFHTPCVKNLRSYVRNLPVAFHVGTSTTSFEAGGNYCCFLDPAPPSSSSPPPLSLPSPPPPSSPSPPPPSSPSPPPPLPPPPPAAGSLLDSRRKGMSLTAVVVNCRRRPTLLPLPRLSGTKPTGGGHPDKWD